MSNITVIIDNKVADLPQNGLNLPLTYSIKSRDGLAVNTGSRSEYAFELPATKQNDDIFNRFYDAGTLSYNQQIFLDASIEVDGLPFFIGKCQLQSVTLRQDAYLWTGESYKVAFYGTNADWVISIGDLRISELPFTAHIYSYLDNISAWAYEYPVNDYKYLPLKLKDYTTFGQLDALEDSHPALFVADILNKTFNSIGYTIESDFFDTDFGKRLIVPIPILSKSLAGQFSIDYMNASYYELAVPYTFVGAQIICTNQTVFPAIGANPYNVGTGDYTAPYTGFFLFKFRVDLYNITGLGAPDFAYTINFGPFNIFLQPTISSLTDISFEFEQVIQLNAGDVLSFLFGGVFAGADADYYIDIIGEAEIINGITLDFAYIIDQSWKAIDFIKGIAHAFNLCFDTDEGGRKVYIEPSDKYLNEIRFPNSRSLEDGFYNSSTDLTQYIDLSKGGELVNDTKQVDSYRLKWKEDNNDPTVEAMNENQSLGILEARYVYPLTRYKKGETIIENPFFAPTIVLADEEIRETSSTKIPMIPFIWAVNYLETSTSTETPSQLLPRILVSEKVGNNGDFNVYDGGGVGVYPAPLNYMVDYNDTDGYQMSLSFANETVNGNNIIGLMQRFYLSELMRLQSGKYLEIFLLWDILMLQNLTFRDKIIIGNDRYILEEINTFNVAKKASTKTYLKYDFIEVDAEDNIENTILIGKVNT